MKAKIIKMDQINKYYVAPSLKVDSKYFNKYIAKITIKSKHATSFKEKLNKFKVEPKFVLHQKIRTGNLSINSKIRNKVGGNC